MVLYFNNFYSQSGICGIDSGCQRSENGIQFVDVTARFNARMALEHPFSAEQAGSAPIPTAGVKFHFIDWADNSFKSRHFG
jgi:hypothetical protein